MKNKDTKQFILEFCQEILLESGLKESQPKYQELLKTIGQRVDARLFLETIAMLTPAQAALVKDDMEKNNPEPEKILAKIAEQIPDFQPRIAQILAKLKSELVQDLSSSL